jgi:hypothetical protein
LRPRWRSSDSGINSAVREDDTEMPKNLGPCDRRPATPASVASLLASAGSFRVKQKRDAFVTDPVGAAGGIAAARRRVLRCSSGRTRRDRSSGCAEAALATISAISPANRQAGVAVSGKPSSVSRCDWPQTRCCSPTIFATFGARRVCARVHRTCHRPEGRHAILSGTVARQRPSESDTDALSCDLLAVPWTLEGDGQPGGVATIESDTLSLTPGVRRPGSQGSA